MSWAEIDTHRDTPNTKFIRFNKEIVAARFANGRWHIDTAKGKADIADVFVCTAGFLHKPLFPEIAGRQRFAGPSFHLRALRTLLWHNVRMPGDARVSPGNHSSPSRYRINTGVVPNSDKLSPGFTQGQFVAELEERLKVTSPASSSSRIG